MCAGQSVNHQASALCLACRSSPYLPLPQLEVTAVSPASMCSAKGEPTKKYRQTLTTHSGVFLSYSFTVRSGCTGKPPVSPQVDAVSVSYSWLQKKRNPRDYPLLSWRPFIPSTVLCLRWGAGLPLLHCYACTLPGLPTCLQKLQPCSHCGTFVWVFLIVLPHHLNICTLVLRSSNTWMKRSEC